MHQFVGKKTFFAYTFCAILLGAICSTPSASAATKPTQRATEIQVGATQRFSVFGKFTGGATVAVADVNGDGVDEYIIGAGPTGGPHIIILNQGGMTVGQFFAFDTKNRDGVNVAAGDLDGDGRAEIVAALQAGGKPEVRVFSGDGIRLRSFTAFESNFSGGVSVAIIPARNGSEGQIVTSSGFGREAEVKIFNAQGTAVATSWLPLGKQASNGVSVAAGWSDAFGQNIVVVGAGSGVWPLTQIYSATTHDKLAQWLSYDKRITTGISVGYKNDVVVTAPLAGGGPDVRTFSIRGEQNSSSLFFESVYRGGLNVSLALVAGALTPVAVPTTTPTTAAGSGKKIVVSLSKQSMTLFEKGRPVSVRKISSGKWSTPTPVGEFKVKNKISVAYSRAYGLYMENWMAFSADGRYGLHSLPYWKLKDGGKLYEGAAHIGTPVSHGCVRQTLVDSKTLFDWTPVGTPVTIQS